MAPTELTLFDSEPEDDEEVAANEPELVRVDDEELELKEEPATELLGLVVDCPAMAKVNTIANTTKRRVGRSIVSCGLRRRR